MGWSAAAMAGPDGSLSTLSPDGAHTAWVRWHDEGPNDLMLADSTTGEEQRLGPVDGRWPRFLDDDHVLACGGGHCDVYGLDGSHEQVALGEDSYGGVRDGALLVRRDHPDGVALVRADDRDGEPLHVGPAWDALFWQDDTVVGRVRVDRWKRGAGYRKGTQVFLEDRLIVDVRHFPGMPRLFAVAPSGLVDKDGGLYVIEPDPDRPPALFRHDVESGERTEVFRPERGTILSLLQDEGGQVVAVKTSGSIQAWHPVVDHPFTDRVLELEGRHGTVRVLGRSDDDQTWLVRVESDIQPPHDRVVHFGDDSVRTVPVGAHPDYGEVDGPRPMQMGRYRSGDYDIDVLAVTPDPGRHPAPWPIVVRVHGGPWSGFYQWGWDERAQELAAEGYLVVAPNFRGSAHVSPAFQNQPAEEWVTGMLDDIVAAVDWAAERGGDLERAAFVGHSYGGTATMAIAVHHPDVPACGVAWSGVADTRCGFGGRRFPYCFQGRDFRRRSPLLAVDQLDSPLLLLHGDADRTTPLQKVERFAAKADRLGVGPVTLHVWEGVDHSWDEDSLDEGEGLERDFLRACLDPERATVADPAP